MRSRAELLVATLLLTGVAAAAQGQRGAAYSEPNSAAAAAATPAAVPTSAPAAVAAPADAPPPEVPAGYDGVGYAQVGTSGEVLHRQLPPGDFVEVTALNTGRTVLLTVAGPTDGDEEITLSPAAARALGVGAGGRAAVRVRSARPNPADRGALLNGDGVLARADSPPVLLNALRRKLAASTRPAAPVAGKSTALPPRRAPVAAPAPQLAPPSPAPQPATSRPARVPAPPARTGGGPGYYVQLVALSDAARAQSVARSVGGGVSSSGRIHRVRLGPYPSQAAAKAARDGIAGRGYGDARIVRE